MGCWICFKVHAIFLHFLGDALSSVFVLATALLWYFFPTSKDVPAQNFWVRYIDPAASMIVVGIILFSTIPLVRNVLSVLLQRAPKVWVCSVWAISWQNVIGCGCDAHCVWAAPNRSRSQCARFAHLGVDFWCESGVGAHGHSGLGWGVHGGSERGAASFSSQSHSFRHHSTRVCLGRPPWTNTLPGNVCGGLCWGLLVSK